VTEPWKVWDESVLKGQRAMEWLGWEGPKRSQNYGMAGVGGSLKVTEPWNFWDERVLTGQSTLQLLE